MDAMTADRRPEVDAIRLSPADNVATVLRPVEPGERLRVRCGAEIVTVTVRESIPFCHKVSLTEIAAEVPVVKYGSPIGGALTAIPAGAHVHVHNMRSARAKRQP
jgi:hypothetical protein